jgi:hypothetical protein
MQGGKTRRPPCAARCARYAMSESESWCCAQANSVRCSAEANAKSSIAGAALAGAVALGVAGEALADIGTYSNVQTVPEQVSCLGVCLPLRPFTTMCDLLSNRLCFSPAHLQCKKICASNAQACTPCIYKARFCSSSPGFHCIN